MNATERFVSSINVTIMCLQYEYFVVVFYVSGTLFRSFLMQSVNLSTLLGSLLVLSVFFYQ